MITAQTIKVYPLSDPTKVLKYIDVTGKNIAGSSVPWEDNIQYWQKLHQVLDFEPVLDEYRAMYGVLSQLGIEKGKPFDPDTRTKAILERARRDGKGQMLAASFDSPAAGSGQVLCPTMETSTRHQASTKKDVTAGLCKHLPALRPCLTARPMPDRSTGSAYATKTATGSMAGRLTN
jgi:hypothetical protein